MTSRQSMRSALPTWMCGEARSGRRSTSCAERLRESDVGLVVGQPQRDLGDAGGEFLDLDAVELVDVELGKPVHVVERHFALAAAKLYQDFEFQLAEFAVGEDEEVAAAAGGIEETELGQLVVKLLQSRGAAGGAVGLDASRTRRGVRRGTGSG